MLNFLCYFVQIRRKIIEAWKKFWYFHQIIWPNWANFQYCDEAYVKHKLRWKLSLILETRNKTAVWELIYVIGLQMTLTYVIVVCSLCWQDTFIGQNSRSSNSEVTKRKSRVSNWKPIPVNYTKTNALTVRSLS